MTRQKFVEALLPALQLVFTDGDERIAKGRLMQRIDNLRPDFGNQQPGRYLELVDEAYAVACRPSINRELVAMADKISYYAFTTET